jgi:replicative superfamily II helicase
MPEVVRIEDLHDLADTTSFQYAKYPFDKFNCIQSRLLEIVEKDCNIAVSASTSGGKTVCAEIFMSHAIRTGKGKAIYIGPMRALAREKEQDWKKPTHHFSDLKVSICTGDYRLTTSRVKELDDADIIVMTPEMLASRARNASSEKSRFLQDVAVVCFDESHLLTVPGRGDHIEVALMKLAKINPNIRVVLLSATMPNTAQICEWVTRLTNRDTYFLESKYRPCPLGIHYETYFDGDRRYHDRELAKIATTVGIVNHYSDDKFLCFTHTIDTGKKLVEQLKRYRIDAEFHYSNLTAEKRESLEERFRKDPKPRVVVATSTLAWGCYSHDARLLQHGGRLLNAENVKAGTKLLCPTGPGFEERKVIRAESFVGDGYEISLESGERMVVSTDHVFWGAVKRIPPAWVQVGDLRPRDFLATPADLGLWKTGALFDPLWYLLGFGFGDGSLTDCGTYADGEWKGVLDLCLGHRDEFADIICRTFNDYFNTNYEMRDDSNGVPHLRSKRRDIVDHFSSHLPIGRKDGRHDVPAEIYACQRNLVNFLSGWFDADGGLEDHSNGNYSVGLTCISKRAVESARTILLGFGIHSSFGRKKMQDAVINGRLQKAVRPFSYRLRIFGQDGLRRFQECIGFRHPEKATALCRYLSEFDGPSLTKDLVPARRLVKEHLAQHGISSYKCRRRFGIDVWNAVNKQDCNRAVLEKLLQATDDDSRLGELVRAPVRWSRIKTITPVTGVKFREIEVEKPHAYVGQNVISHNCNLPARRVVIVGVDRGMQKVANYDIKQMVGRSGRLGFDPRGDAYILVPESSRDEVVAMLQKQDEIRSQLLENVGGLHKTLAFHVVSEIHHGQVTTREAFHEWFQKSLAHYQDHEFDDDAVDRVIDLLQKKKCITIEGGEYKTTGIGAVASMFYFSPFDAADLVTNFKTLFHLNHEKNDLAVAVALGNLDGFRFGIANKAEQTEMEPFVKQVEEKVGRTLGLTNGAYKAAYGYWLLMNGIDNSTFASYTATLRGDAERTMEVVTALDSLSAKWNKQDFLKTLRLRMSYGVQSHLVSLCQIPNIGKVRAEKLYKANIRSIDDFLKADEGKLATITGVGKDKIHDAAEQMRTAKFKDLI